MLALILSLLGVGGVGAAVAAFMFPAFGGMLAGALRGLWNFIRSIPWQIWLGLAIAGVIAFLIFSRSHWIERAHRDEAQLDTICRAARIAAHNPKLDCAQAAAQILELGRSLENTRASLDHQNAAIATWQAKAAAQQQIAQEARKQASGAAQSAEAVRDQLRAQTRSAAGRRASAVPCEPDDALKEQWQ